MNVIDKLNCDVYIGSTGTGKSTLISLRTKEPVIRGHTTESTTKDLTFYEGEMNNLLLDTQGAEDSDNKENDEQICKKVLVALFNKNVQNVRIIWTIRSCEKDTSNIQKQAKFINQLKPQEIWKSVVIILKDLHIIDKVAGALAAAGQNECNVNIPWQGISCFDWNKQDPSLQILIQNIPDVQRPKIGLFYENEVKLVSLELINQVFHCKILKYDEKCTKCGIQGDSRIFPSFCHLKSEFEKYHPLQKIHNGDIERYHLSSSEKIHIGNAKSEQYHQYVGSIWSSLSEDYHPGQITTATVYNTQAYYEHDFSKGYTHPGVYQTRGSKFGRFLFGVVTVGISEGVANFDGWTCCGSTTKYGTQCRLVCCQGTKDSQGCKIRYRDNPTSKEYWSCCNGEPNSAGCKERWSCCEKSKSAPGCTTISKYACCNQPLTSEGCTNRFPCCKYANINTNQEINQSLINSDPKLQEGCMEKYSCCQKSLDSTPCIWSCCNNKVENQSTGCQNRCGACKGEWNKPPSENSPCFIIRDLSNLHIIKNK